MPRGGTRTGAGRPRWRRDAESCLRIDIRELARRNLLDRGHFGWNWSDSLGRSTGSVNAFTERHRLTLTFSSRGHGVTQNFDIERTPCPLGGARPWIRCCDCGRRVAILYFVDRRFTCRRCGRVSYLSQRQDAIGRSWLRQAKLERHLAEDWDRPSGMRWATYNRLLDRLAACAEERDGLIFGALQRLGLPDVW